MVGVLVGLNFPFIICNKGVVMKNLSILLIACLCLNVAAYAWVQSKEEADANYKKHRRIYNLQRCDMMINWRKMHT